MDTATYGALSSKIKKLADTIDETAASTTEAWLEENIDPASDYALDRTLSMENAAAPADMVGDLKSAIKSDNYYTFTDNDLGVTTGKYINATGAEAAYASSEHTKLIEIDPLCDYYVSLRGYSAINGVVYIGADGTTAVGDALNKETPYVDEKLIIPSNAKYFYCNTWTKYAIDGVIYTAKIEIKRTTTIKDELSLVEHYLPNWVGKKWLVVGDSWTAPSNDFTNYHKYIADKTGIKVINKGEGGTGFMHTKSSNTAYYQKIQGITETYDIITIFGSGNDLSEFIETPGVYTDDTDSTVAGCINLTIDNLLSENPGAVVGIMSPPPWGGYTISVGEEEKGNMQKYSDLLKTICTKRGIPFLNLYEESGLRPWDTNFLDEFYLNYAHANSKGHQMFVPKVFEFLKKLIMY